MSKLLSAVALGGLLFQIPCLAAENFQCQNESDAVTGSVDATRSPNVFIVKIKALNGASTEFKANPATGYDYELNESTAGYYDFSTANSYLALESRVRRDGSIYKLLTVRSAALFGDTESRKLRCL